MTSAVVVDRVRNVGMAKPRKTKPEPPRKTPRINVGIPADWHAIARRVAAKRRQPVLFMLITAIQREAEQEGISNFPPAPWGEEDDE
jgi:hypothetical protein